MKKWFFAAFLLAAIAGGAYYYAEGGTAGSFLGQAPAPTKAPVAVPVKATNRIISDAKVMPSRRATIGPASPGTVAEVLVAEGDIVEAGQVLARMDSARAEATVAQAEAGLSRAQARLAETRAGARPQEVEASRAAVEAARAQLAKVEQGAREEDIVAAAAALIASQASLAKTQETTTDDKIAAASADLARLKDGATTEDILAAEIAVEQAKASLWGMQSERDGICGRAAGYQCDSATAKVGTAERAVELAINNVAKVKAAPRQPDIAAAQSRLDELLKGPNNNTVAAAEAQVQQAEAALEKVKAPARPADIAAAQAEIRRAQAQLALVQAGSRSETISAAEADVASARATLQQAQAVLAETEIKAPFSGTLASVDIRPGEFLLAGAPVLSLADLSNWQIETTDLTELSVVRVQEGDKVKITFDAMPGLELPGTVTRIKFLGEKKQGDILYTAVVRPDRHEDRLRWNMTASVSIEPREPDVKE